MTSEIWCWIWGISFVVCLAILIAAICYYRKQWDKLEWMLENAEKSFYGSERLELQETTIRFWN